MASAWSKLKKLSTNLSNANPKHAFETIAGGAGSQQITPGTSVNDVSKKMEPLAQQAAAYQAAPWEAGGGGRPVDPAHMGVLDANGQLMPQYQMSNPEDIAAGQVVSGGTLKPGKVSVKSLKSGGKLNVGTVNAGGPVTMKSMMGDAEGRLAGIKADDSSMKELRSRALGTGESAWLKAAKGRQGVEETDALEGARSAAAGAAATQASNLAMRGGIGGGARERLAGNAIKQSLMANQTTRRQGQMDRSGLEMQDEATKLDLLKGMPAAELAWMQPELQKAGMLNDIQGTEQGRQLDTDLANRATDIDVQKTNVGNRAEGDKFNIQNTQDVGKFNIGTNLDVQKTNVGNSMEGDRFNILNDQDVQKTNVGNNLDTAKFNTGLDADTSKFNTANTLGAVGENNTWNLDKYKAGMSEWGAGKSADALAAKSGKK